MEHAKSLWNSSDATTFEIFENSDSQNRQILAYLIAGNTIDPHAARLMFGCERLASRIHDLRDIGKEQGFVIVTERVSYKTANGKHKTYAKYHLKEGTSDG